MKKIFIAVMFLAVMLSVPVFADNYESIVVLASTNTVTGNDYQWGANPLVVSSGQKVVLIKELDISGTEGVENVVTLYDGWTNGTSSAAVTKIWEIKVTTDSQVYSKTFCDGDRGHLKADYGLALRKSSTAGEVRVSIQYK